MERSRNRIDSSRRPDSGFRRITLGIGGISTIAAAILLKVCTASTPPEEKTPSFPASVSAKAAPVKNTNSGQKYARSPLNTPASTAEASAQEDPNEKILIEAGCLDEKGSIGCEPNLLKFTVSKVIANCAEEVGAKCSHISDEVLCRGPKGSYAFQTGINRDGDIKVTIEPTDGDSIVREEEGGASNNLDEGNTFNDPNRICEEVKTAMTKRRALYCPDCPPLPEMPNQDEGSENEEECSYPSTDPHKGTYNNIPYTARNHMITYGENQHGIIKEYTLADGRYFIEVARGENARTNNFDFPGIQHTGGKCEFIRDVSSSMDGWQQAINALVSKITFLGLGDYGFDGNWYAYAINDTEAEFIYIGEGTIKATLTRDGSFKNIKLGEHPFESIEKLADFIKYK